MSTERDRQDALMCIGLRAATEWGSRAGLLPASRTLAGDLFAAFWVPRRNAESWWRMISPPR